MVNKLDNLKLKEVNYIKTVYSFEFSLLNLIYDEYIDLHCETHKNAIQYFKSVSLLIALHIYLHKYFSYVLEYYIMGKLQSWFSTLLVQQLIVIQSCSVGGINGSIL